MKAQRTKNSRTVTSNIATGKIKSTNISFVPVSTSFVSQNPLVQPKQNYSRVDAAYHHIFVSKGPDKER